MGKDRATITKTGKNGPTEKRRSGTGRCDAMDFQNGSPMEGSSRILWSMENCLQQFPALAGRWSVGKYPQESESRFRFTVANHGGFDQCKSASAQCWCKKGGPPNEIGHSRGGASTKIHAAVDAYGYPVYLMISEGQRNDINYAIPVLEKINIEGSLVMADRGYDSYNLIDYIYENGGEPIIPSKKGAKFERHCDWWQYKERHLVEKYFLKLKAFRRIATRYDKLACTYLGFLCIASILIWIK